MPTFRGFATVIVGRAGFRRQSSGRPLAVFAALLLLLAAVAATGELVPLPGLPGAPQAGDGGSERGAPDARPAQGSEAPARPFWGTLAQALHAAGAVSSADFLSAPPWPVLAGAPGHAALLPQAHAQTPDAGAFVTTWNTTGESISTSYSMASVRFHIGVASGGQADIDWGDGSPPRSYNASGPVSRIYLYEGPPVLRNNTVSISGNLTHFYFHYYHLSQTGDTPDALLSLDQWGDAKWSDMTGMFRGATNMQYRATDAPDLSSGPSVANMFYKTYFNGDISGWDVSPLTSTRYMFNKASSFNGDISGWDVSNVTDMTYMFSDAHTFNGDISGWDVSSVERMAQMFQAAESFNGDISGWDVSSVENMYGMFLAAESFNGDISGWDVSSVDEPYGMANLLYNAYAFDRNLGPWFIVLEDTHIDHGVTPVSSISPQVGFDTGVDSYSITGADADHFAITDGRLVLNSASDYHSKPEYHITITANTTEVSAISPGMEHSISPTIRVEPPSQSTPAVASITRHDPAFATTDSGTLVFGVAFSKDVTGVDAGDFELAPGSAGDGTLVYAYSSSPALYVPYDAYRNDTITVTDSGAASSVSVSVDVEHDYIGDLLVQLVAPDGTTMTLHDHTGGSDANITRTYEVGLAGTEISGNWTMRLHDNYDGDEGTLHSWNLTLGVDVDPEISVAGSGSRYLVTVASPQPGTYNLDVAEGNDIADGSGRALSGLAPAGDDQSYAVTPPSRPVITLAGQPTVYVPTGSVYADDGAACDDGNGNDISSRLVTTNPVNTSVADTYAVTYECSSDSGRSAVPATRTVTVSDPPPHVESITRYDPAEAATDSGTLVFGVAFSKDVTGVDAGDFELAPGSAGDGTLVYAYSSSPALYVPYDAYRNDTITVTDSGAASSVSVSVDVEHDYIGDLLVQLVAPDGTTMTLHDHTGGSDANITRTYEVGLAGTEISGNWTMRLHDNYDGDEGTLHSWNLTLGVDVDPEISVAGSGSRYLVTVASPQPGTYNLDVAEGNDIADGSGRALSGLAPAGDDQSYAVTPPSRPVITLAGQPTVYVPTGSVYADDGAACDDGNGNDISSRLVTTNPVNTSVADTYAVTYECSSDSGRSAVPATRTVTVSDPPPHVESITRYDPAEAATDSGTLVFGVAFSKDVTGVDAGDFELAPGSAGDGTLVYAYSSSPALYVPYDAYRNDTITVTDSGAASSVSVSVDVEHDYIGDLLVQLVAPDGTTMTLHNRTDYGNDNITRTYEVGLAGTEISGNWTMRLHDNYDGDEGTLHSWNLTLGVDVDPEISVAGSGSRYLVTVASPQPGTYNLDVAEGNDIADGSGRALSGLAPAGDDQSYAVTPPSRPVITLAGQPTVYVPTGSVYADDGAACDDGNGNDISSRLVTTNPVNTSVADTYAVTYECSSDSGRSAVPATRTVTVSDPPPHVESITRYDPAEAATDSGTLVFGVAFSKAVTGVDAGDFELAPGSPGANHLGRTYSSSPALYVPYDAYRNDTITVTDSGAASSVSVSVDVEHDYIGDLLVQLVAPDGTTRTLHDRAGRSADDITETYEVGLAGTEISGNWTMRLHDNYDGDEGTLHSWNLTLGVDVDPEISVAGSGSRYLVTVASPQPGTYNLDVAEGNDIADGSGRALSGLAPAGDDQSYTVTAAHGFKTFTRTSSPALSVPYDVYATDTITVTDSGAASSVSVSVDVEHDYIGDLLVQLVAPDGTTRTLHDRAGRSSDDITETYEVGLAGTEINGTWVLRLHDNHDADQGTLNSWTLAIDY